MTHGSVKIVVLAIFFGILGCATMRGRWGDTKSRDTIYAYEDFLRRYPEGQLADSARVRLQVLCFERASGHDNVVSYKEFLERFPEGALADQARSRLEQLVTKQQFGRAELFNTIEAYEDFLAQHPRGVYADSARLRLESLYIELEQARLAFNHAAKYPSVTAFSEYLKRFPRGADADEARKRIEKLRFDEAQSYNSVEAYEEYLSQYPQGAFVGEAIEGIAWITAKQENNLTAYNEFLGRYPNGRFSDQAREAITWIRRAPERTAIIDQTITLIETSGPAGRFVIRGLKPIGDSRGTVFIDATESFGYKVWGPYTGDGFDLSCLFSLSSTYTVCYHIFPFGHGTVFHLIGRVSLANFFKEEYNSIAGTEAQENEIIQELEGYEFTSKGTGRLESLVFVLAKNVGFVYVAGKGEVVLPGGKVIELGLEPR